ncbi:MAG TPA: YggT family protein [Thermoanaerobaculia bacterium]|jgi:YggT family protein|nr:YggT family protein [Thermoanaerobaculia bacterium]HXM77703.1 YggT family protein [Thermoanaerobaculia bacterium]
MTVVFALLNIIKWLVIIAAVISWLNPDPRNPIVQFLYKTTEPLLRPFRRLLPPGRTGGIDFSPLVLILLIVFIEAVLSRLLAQPYGLSFQS